MSSLPRWRADIAAQTRVPDEIVIVDNLSTDGTQEFLSEWATNCPTVKVHEVKCGAAQGRNIAIRLSENDHIVSTDMGVRLDPEWFAERESSPASPAPPTSTYSRGGPLHRRDD